MKTNSLSALCLSCCLIFGLPLTNVKAQTSVYHPFPESIASWNFTVECMTGPGSSEDQYSIIITGDTVINTLTYHKLSTPFVLVNGNTCGSASGYKGAFRQDVVNRRVYFVKPSGFTEQLAYDFNWQVGDTLRGCLSAFTGQPMLIHSIDSVLVGTDYRKRWVIDSCYGTNVIEGIGSNYHLFGQTPGCITDFPYVIIDCFKQDGMVIYPSTAGTCNIITHVPVLQKFSYAVRIYPNPSSGNFTVEVDPSIQVKEIRLTDLVGRLILKRNSGNLSIVSFSKLTGGTYILTIIDKNMMATNRKVSITPGKD